MTNELSPRATQRYAPWNTSGKQGGQLLGITVTQGSSVVAALGSTIADLYVGHFATAIFKLLLNTLLWFSAIAFIDYMSQFFPYRSVTMLVSCTYFLFAIITGYRTVIRSRSEQTPSN